MQQPLNDKVKRSIDRLLRDVYPIWQHRQLKDMSRVWHRTQPGQHSLNIEPSAGAQTSIEFINQIANRDSYKEFVATIERCQPSLFHFLILPSMSASLRYPEMWIATWCTYLDEKLNKETFDNAIACLTHDIDTLIVNELGTYKGLTPITGLSLPASTESIDLGDLVVRNLTPDEFGKLTKTDVTDVHGIDQQMMWVKAAAFQKFPVSVRISENSPEEFSRDHPYQKIEEGLSRLARALHILKPGSISYVTTLGTIEPTVLPFLSGSRIGLSPHRWNASMVLDEEDVPRLKELYRHMINCRPEISVGAARLVDAESRSSPADTILDCAIGLETLLNSSARDELTFRVRLNYAFLGRPEDRATRADELTKLYRERGRIVHGGMRPNDLHPAQDAWRQLSTIADQGKRSLRDTLNKFLDDPDLRKSAELNSDFWLRRILGS